MERYEIIRYHETIFLLDLFDLTMSVADGIGMDDLDGIQQNVTPEEFAKYLAKAKILHRGQESNIKFTQFTLILTYNCNFECQYCFERHIPERYCQWTMPKESVDKIFAISNELNREYEFTIRLSGGEPLLLENMEIVTHVLEQAQKYGYQVKITSNGYTLTEYATLLNRYASLIKSVTVTIDGMTPLQSKRRRLRSGDPYSVEKIITGIKLISDQIQVIVNTTVDTENLDDFAQTLAFIKNELIDTNLTSTVRIAPASAYQTHYSPEMDANFLHELPARIQAITKHWSMQDRAKLDIFARGCKRVSEILKTAFACSARPIYPLFGCSPRDLTFDPYGSIYLCDLFLGNEEGKIGQYLPELSFTDHYTNLRNRSVFTLEKCQNCKYIFLCGAGCTYDAFCQTGDPLRENCLAFSGEHKEALFDQYIDFVLNSQISIQEELTE